MVKDANELRADTAGTASSNGAHVGAEKRISVGFIGLGRMGTVMAGNLATAGYQVIAHVRHAERFVELEASVSSRPRKWPISSTVNSSSACCRTMKLHALSCLAVLRMRSVDSATGLKPGALHISMSTISTTASAQLAMEHARCGQSYVAAPVFGNPDAAKARQLFIVAAGAPADVQRCQPLFDNLGQKTFVISTIRARQPRQVAW